MKLLAIAALLAACTSNPFVALKTRVPVSEMPAKLTPTMTERFTAFAVNTLAERPERGAVRELQVFGQSCRWGGPNPVILRPRTEPRVGVPLVVAWQLSCVPPPPLVVEADGSTHPPAVMLLVSFAPLATPWPGGEAAPGCFLLVNPDYALAPLATGWLRYDPARQIVTMEFTPASGLEGVSIYTQLVVARPGANPAGIIVSNGLEIHLGVSR